jgi:hypothetical protein
MCSGVGSGIISESCMIGFLSQVGLRAQYVAPLQILSLFDRGFHFKAEMFAVI